MKRLRIILCAMAVVLAVGASFAFREKTDPPCRYSQQYYKIGFNTFQPTGQLGLHYVCFMTPQICTYYLPDPVLAPEDFHPCQQGAYYPIYTQP